MSARRRGSFTKKTSIRAGATAALLLAATMALAAEPLGGAVSAAFGPDGRLWRAMAQRARLAVDHSLDGGATFSTPVTIEAPGQRLRVDPEGRVGLAVDREGRVYVGWSAEAGGRAQAYLAYSTDGGQTFSSPLPVSGAGEGPQIRVHVSVGADRAARLLFLDPAGGHGHGSGGGGTLYSALLQPGATPSLAATRLAPSTCECCRLDAETDSDGSMLVLSRMVFAPNVRDFGLIRTAAEGPATVSRLTDDDWRLDGCPEHGAALAIGAEGRYHLAWFTQGARRQGLFYAWSDDRGATLSPPLPLGEADALAGHADVLAAGGRVYLVWQQFDGERTSIHAMDSADNGAHWSPARQIATTEAAADYPLLLSDGRGVYVSWYAARPGYRLFALSEAGET